MDVKQIILLIVIFVPFELLRPLRPAQRVFRQQWFNDAFYLLFNSIVIRIGFTALAVAILPLVDGLLPAAVTDFVARQPMWIELPAAFVCAEIGFYFMHRSFHHFPLLWRFHAVHHSIEELDWLAAHRLHPVDQTLTAFASLLPLLALGFSAQTMATYAAVHLLLTHLVHANVRLDFGVFRWFIASPQFHHWHHANEPDAHDRNYSQLLIFMDMLGGTLNMPARMPERYGTDDPVPTNYLLQLAYPFRPHKPPATLETGPAE